MLSALDRKLFRDLAHMKAQMVAIAMVMACGVAILVTTLSALRSLRQTMEGYYEGYRFAEVFASLTRAPDSLHPRIAEIPGVAQVQTRIVRSVILDVEDFPEPVIGRLISVPGERPADLNLLYLRGGRWLDPDRQDEALVSETFANAHDLKPGDSIEAIINGKLERLRLVGTVLSPEFVWTIRPGDIVPDDKRYGVLWVGERMLESAFDMDGAFNDVTLALEHGASEQDVIARLDDLLEPYGSAGSYAREDHPSHEFVANEIAQLRAQSFVAPTIFLSVAAFLLNVVISRLIATQREQIATLKAVGYGKASIGLHYLKFVLVISLLGATIGLCFGALLGRLVTELYARFFHFPSFSFVLDTAAAVTAIGLSSLAGMIGAAGAVWGATRLAPAEAMRPQAPAVYRPTLIERIGAQRLLTPVGRMILRQLERRPMRALLSCVGIALAVGIMIVGAFVQDAVNFVMDHQFQTVQRQDVTVGFAEATEGDVLADVAHLPGVTHVEPFRSLAVRIHSGPISRRLGIMALTPDSTLFALLDASGQPVELPPEGIVISDMLAKRLDVRPGDMVTIEILEAERPTTEVLVSGIVREFTGTSAYMRLDAANRLMKRGEVVSGAFIAADPERVAALYDELKRVPQVASVSIKLAALQSFRDTIAQNLMVMRTLNVTFACIIAFGVIYNSARIALSERSRELATMRVIGFTRGEISFILLGELATLVAIAIPLGLVVGHWLARLATIAFETEMFRVPFIIEPSTYGFAAVVAMIAATVSGLAVRRRLDKLDLVGVLKTWE